MEALLSKINENVYWVFVLAIIGLAGTIWGWWQHNKSKRNKGISVFTEHSTLIGDVSASSLSLEVRCEGVAVTTLKSAVVTMCNTGNCDISTDDMLEPIILFIEADVVRIALMDEDKSKVCGFAIAEEDNFVRVTFKYVRPGDCIRIQVLYSSEAISINFNGVVKDGYINDGTKKLRKKVSLLDILISTILSLCWIFVLLFTSILLNAALQFGSIVCFIAVTTLSLALLLAGGLQFISKTARGFAWKLTGKHGKRRG